MSKHRRRRVRAVIDWIKREPVNAWGYVQYGVIGAVSLVPGYGGVKTLVGGAMTKVGADIVRKAVVPTEKMTPEATASVVVANMPPEAQALVVNAPAGVSFVNESTEES